MQQGKPGTPIVYEVFDLLEVDGEPLVDLPLRERRARLEQLLDRRYTTVRLSEAFEDGDALYEAAQAAAPGGDRRQAGRLAVPAGKADARVAEDQDARPAGVRDRRLHEGPGAALGPLRLTRARCMARRRARLRRQRRHRLHGQGDRRPAGEAAAARTEGEPFPCRPEDAEGAQGGRGLGEAGAGLRGRVRRVDARRPVAGPVVPGAAGGQDRARGPPRGAAPDRAAPRKPHAQAVQPRQGLLPGRRDHQGRPARLLPLGCARPAAAPEATGRSR